jgi:uncharacterized membrane protein YagU involved in acid resistance
MTEGQFEGTTRPATTQLVWIGCVAGSVAAVVEMIPILLIQGLLLHVGPLRIFQSIASGLLGAGAYAGGFSSAVLGALLHLLISVVAGLIYAVAASRFDILLKRPVLGGIAYGVIVYLVMSYIVVPLSAVAFKPATNPSLMAMSLAIHIMAFALPISLVCKRSFGVLARKQPHDVQRVGELDFGR